MNSFGCRFGRAKADAQKFLTSFQDVYCLERVRVMGDDVRLLKCYPGDWQVRIHITLVSESLHPTCNPVCNPNVTQGLGQCALQ